MDVIIQLFQSLLSRLNPAAIVDILIVGVLIYGLLSLLQGTRAVIVLRGAFLLIFLLLGLVTFWPLPVLSWLVTNSLPALLISIPVIFQQEIRRALEQIGHTGDLLNRSLNLRTAAIQRDTVDAMVSASVFLSNQRWGGLIVIERETGLQDIVEGSSSAVPIEGKVTRQLLENVFVPNTPLHDGAVVVRENELVAAAVMLPLSDNPNTPQHYGTRHRAALGVTENSDAIAIVVSEETGAISFAEAGKLYIRLNRDELTHKLEEALQINLPATRRAIFKLPRNGQVTPSTVIGKDQYKIQIKPTSTPAVNGKAAVQTEVNSREGQKPTVREQSNPLENKG
jgi:diadenylate cyclase